MKTATKMMKTEVPMTPKKLPREEFNGGEKNLSFASPASFSTVSVLDQLADVACSFAEEDKKIVTGQDSRVESDPNPSTADPGTSDMIQQITKSSQQLLLKLADSENNKLSEQESQEIAKNLLTNAVLLNSFHSSTSRGVNSAMSLMTPVTNKTQSIFKDESFISPQKDERREVQDSDVLKRRLFCNNLDDEELNLVSELTNMRKSQSFTSMNSAFGLPPLRQKSHSERHLLRPSMSTSGIDSLNRRERKSKSKGMRNFIHLAQGKVFTNSSSDSEPDGLMWSNPNSFSYLNTPQVKLVPTKRLRKQKKSPKQKKEKKSSQARKKRKNEWNDEEIVVLLQVTKIMIDCELKSVAKALFEIIERSPGKSYGRAAEKKLKRMQIFENWKKCDKEQALKNIDKKLCEFGELGSVVKPRTLQIANRYKFAEIGLRGRPNVRQTSQGMSPERRRLNVEAQVLSSIVQQIENNSQSRYTDTRVSLLARPFA